MPVYIASVVAGKPTGMIIHRPVILDLEKSDSVGANALALEMAIACFPLAEGWMNHTAYAIELTANDYGRIMTIVEDEKHETQTP